MTFRTVAPTPSGDPSPPRTVAQLFLRSSGAAALSQGIRMVTTLGAQLVLRRWIPAEDWGLFQWAMVVFLVLGAVRDLGLAHHVLRVKPRPWTDLLCLELIWGGLLTLLAVLATPWIGGLYSQGEQHPATAGVLQCLALFLLLEGLSTVPKVFLEGELNVGRAVAPELWRNVVFVAGAMALASQGYGVWSLAVGQTLGAAVYAASLWWRVRGQIPWARHRDDTGRAAPGRLLLDALPLSAIWFLAILIRHVDPLILGLRFTFQDLGQYTFAYEWATLASGLILLPAITRVLYPALVRFGEHSPKMFRAFRLSTLVMLTFEVPAALFLFLNAELVIQILGGSQWIDAPTYLRVLCFVPLVDPFSRLGGEVLKTLRWDRLWILASLSTVLTLVIGGYWLTGVLGVMGMAWINLLSPGGLIIAIGLYKASPEGFRRLVSELLYIYLAPIPFFLGAWLLAGGGAPWADPDPWRFAWSLLAGLLSLGVVGRRFGPDFLSFFRGE